MDTCGFESCRGCHMSRLAVVTGGSGGIGAAICKSLLNHTDYEVHSIDVALGSDEDVHYHLCGVTDREGLEVVFQYLEVVDVLVNAAGITKDCFLHKMTQDTWDRVIDVNLTGAFNTTRLAIPGMRERYFGRIVNISSVNGSKGQIGQCNYAASKAGLHGLTMSLAQESAAKGIMVNTVSPGYIDTPMTAKIPDVIRKQIVDSIPVGRMGMPEDIARTVTFLCDEENTYITGANIPVNGGLLTTF